MKLLLILWVAFVSSSPCMAQKGRVTGQIIDFETNKPVGKAAIMLVSPSMTIGITTDEEGRFDVTKSKFKKRTFIFEGQIQYKRESFNEGENKYYSVVINDLKVSRKNKEIHLGKIYTFPLSKTISDKEVSALPCLQINSNKYYYQLSSDVGGYGKAPYLIIDIQTKR